MSQKEKELTVSLSSKDTLSFQGYLLLNSELALAGEKERSLSVK